MNLTWPRLRFFLVQMLLGVGGGIGAGALTASTFSWMLHTKARIVGIPLSGRDLSIVYFWVEALIAFPIVGAVLGIGAGTLCAAPWRRRQLWLGAALGMLIGLSLTVSFPWWPRYHGTYSGNLLDLCFSANLGCIVTGAVIGSIVGWRPTDANRSLFGLTYGAGAGLFATGLIFVGAVPGIETPEPAIPTSVVGSLYALIGFTMLGAFLGLTSGVNPNPLW